MLDGVSFPTTGKVRGRRAWPRVAVLSAIVIGGHVRHLSNRGADCGHHCASVHDGAYRFDRDAGRCAAERRGWGPREGVTAWVFSDAGLHAQRAVAAAVVYGVLVLGASLPGAAVLVVSSLRGTPLRTPTEPLLRKGAAHA
jgi:glycosyltransferase 2 family protein